MILSDTTIRNMISGQGLIKAVHPRTHPLEETQLQPASYDIRLGDSFLIMESIGGIISMDKPVNYREIKTNKYILLPGQFVLATTLEYFTLPDNISAFVEGCSSIGRMGLLVQNAGWVDPGFEGTITLKLYNAGPQAVELRTGRRVGQIVFANMDANAEHPYRNNYPFESHHSD